MPSRVAKNLRVILTALALAFASGTGLADELLRDPTRPYTTSERVLPSSPRFVVNAIIVSPKRRVAIVNGRRVGVGSSLGGATVVAIEQDQVVLESGGKRITAGLNERAMRR